MTDRREAIIKRLFDVVDGITEFTTRARDTITFDDTHLPAVAVLEGDEDITEDERAFSRPSDKPYYPVMTPQIYIRVADNSADLGARINMFRALVIKAVLEDTQLNALSLNGRSVRYAGMQSTLHAARSMVAAYALVFTIRYEFNPKDSITTF